MDFGAVLRDEFGRHRQVVASASLTLRVTVFFWPWTLTVTFFLTVMVVVSAQRFPFAASAEYWPSGSVSSKLPTGTSGTVLNVLDVIPALLMNVCRRGRS